MIHRRHTINGPNSQRAFDAEEFGLRYAESLFGDFDAGDSLDARDIDMLAKRLSGDPREWWLPDEAFDVNQDTTVSPEDSIFWIHEIKRTYFGDANLDGEFNSGDLVEALAAGTYEKETDAGWASGDFDGNGRFDSGDLIYALADGGYEAGPRPVAVPEPSAVILLLVGLLTALSEKTSFGRLLGNKKQKFVKTDFQAANVMMRWAKSMNFRGNHQAALSVDNSFCMIRWRNALRRFA